MSDAFIGEIRLFAFARVPSDWLPCNGQSVSIASAEALYSVIGTIYGGDGQDSFNVPDLRGRVAIGQGTGRALPPYKLGEPGGQETHTLLNTELPIHSHALVSSTLVAQTNKPSADVMLGTASAGNLYAPAQGVTSYLPLAPSVLPSGNSAPHDNMMPTLVCNYCICFQGVFPSQG